ncbi:MAG: gamma-glutamyl-gamma-aminobutyrate hydrolase family protein, partial [Armatimonadota bacterium]
DGVVEAIESTDERFVVGVQWHPERREDAFIYDISGPLFKAFVDAARNRLACRVESDCNGGYC